MRIVFIVLIIIHGIIHLFGFLKAFGITEFHAISQPVSKGYGLMWSLAFVLFAATAVLRLVHNDYWWLSGILAVVISQVLIVNYWSDAKFGTLMNLIILVAAIVGYSSFRFKQRVKQERKALLEDSQSSVIQETVTEKSIVGLPPVIQKWLINSGVVGSQLVHNVYLTQKLELKLKPDQINWQQGQAEQYFSVQPPAFNWSIRTEMNPFLSVVGRDQYVDGKGEMTIRLLSLIPVADAKNEQKTDQATLQRYLAEIVWFPSASLSPYITWEAIDDFTARATMEYKGTQGSGVFHFDEDGNFVKFTAQRYQDSNAVRPIPWTVIANKTKEVHGIKIPIECEASWTLENREWTWLKLKITAIQYNIETMPKLKIGTSLQ